MTFIRFACLLLAATLLAPWPTVAAQTPEPIRIGIPGKLVDFSPFFVGAKTGIYRRRARLHHALPIGAALGGERAPRASNRHLEAAILTPPYTVMAEQKGLNNLVWLGDILGDVPSNGLSTTTKK